MPTYDYACAACKHTFEQYQSITAKPLKRCPKCSKPRLQRLIGTGAGILFRGAGFYETDYRSESYKKAADAEKSAATAKPDAAKSTDGAAATKSDAPKSSAAESTTGATSPAAKDAPAPADGGRKSRKKKAG